MLREQAGQPSRMGVASMTGDGIVLRAITEPEYDRFRDSLSLVFGIDPSEESRARLKRWIELDRTIAAFDGDHIVATGGALTYRLVVPGGALVGAAGVTVVSVNPTHRRRGILTRMMRQQLEDIRDRGEPVAILRASESGIYGRFGYGCAVHAADLTIDRHRGTIRTDAPEPMRGRWSLDPAGRLHLAFEAPERGEEEFRVEALEGDRLVLARVRP